MTSIHASASVAELHREVAALQQRRAADAQLIETLRVHVDDGTESCSVCIAALAEYDKRWG